MSAVLFKLGQKGLTFTDDFFDAIRVMKNYKKGDKRRADVFNSMLNDFFENPNAKSAFVLRALEKKLIDEDIIATNLRSTMSKGKQKAGVGRTDKLSELASANYSFAAKDAQKEAAKIKATSEKRLSQLRDPRFIERSNKARTMAAYRKALPFWMDVSKQLDGTTSILEAIRKQGGTSARLFGSKGGQGGTNVGGWPAQKNLMMRSDDPAVREAAQKIQNEVDFYERHKRAYSYVVPDERTYIQPKGKLQELNVEGFDNRPSAKEVKNILKDPGFKGFIQPYNKLIGEHIMEGRTRNKMERAITDFAKKHGGFKEASYITTNRRNRMKTPLTSEILTNSIKKSELLNSVIPGQKPSAKILEQIKLHDAAIAKASNQLSDLGLETAIFDSAANKGKGKIKYFGKQYNNMSELIQSVNTGQVPGSVGQGGAGGPRFLPMKEITIDGKKVLTNKYQDGGFAGKFSNFLDATKKQFFEGGEYPYEVASNEPIEGDITNLIPTAEAVQMMTAPLTLQPVDDLVDQSLAGLNYDMITDDELQSYLKSRDFALSYKNEYQRALDFFRRQSPRNNFLPESVLEEYLPEGSFVKQEPREDVNEMGMPINEMGMTEQDIINMYQEQINDPMYKEMTRLYTSQEPEVVERRKAIESKYFGNQLKKAGLLTANALIETYQAVAPTAYAGDAIENLAEIKQGDHYLQRELDALKASGEME
jgi:L-fucose mutarotase/ribose pyranase (RbsD/FucU family)